MCDQSLMSIDLVREQLGEHRSHTVLAIRSAEKLAICQECPNECNGDWYHGWPQLHLPIPCLDDHDSDYETDLPPLPFLPRTPNISLTEEMQSLIATIVSGHTSHWDGHNSIGTLSDAALSTARRLVQLVAEQIEAADVSPYGYDGKEPWGVLKFSRERNDDEFLIEDTEVKPDWLCLFWHDVAGTHDDELNLRDRVTWLGDLRDGLECVRELVEIDCHDGSEAIWAFCRRDDLDRIRKLVAAQNAPQG